ncbi:VOC family protein [Pseudochryseolinea flava]|uniref:VOC family protein n=1 Tax=Pseudochryseolinea flava TaxID=2059302 RepID=UPI001C889D42|nr:VOC family protein [Pseudochryseolinea flava]
MRYIVNDVTACVKFYTELLGFDIIMNPPNGFAMLSKGNLRLFLNEPGAGGAGQSMPDGVAPTPGGWNRLQLQTNNLEAVITRLKGKGANFRNELVSAKAGNQVLLLDPAGNLIELFEPKD